MKDLSHDQKHVSFSSFFFVNNARWTSSIDQLSFENENFHPFYRALDCTNDNRVRGEHIAKQIKFIQFIVGIGAMDEGT